MGWIKLASVGNLFYIYIYKALALMTDVATGKRLIKVVLEMLGSGCKFFAFTVSVLHIMRIFRKQP